MPEDSKENQPAPPPGTTPASEPPKAEAAKPAPPAAPAEAKPAAPAAAAPAKPAAPPKPAGPAPEPWNAPLPNALKNRFGSGIKEASVYVGQRYLVVDKAVVPEVVQVLRDEEQFDYCVDITAVHYPKREGAQFDLVWILYSFAHNERIRVKTQIADGEAAPSAVSIWPTANWLERECYDMFGIVFQGHPDLRRILLPDGWKGYPLRKDYSILLQDKDWVHANLGIESGQ